MKEGRNSYLQIKLCPTSKEKEEILNLFTELGISKQRQSEVFITDIIEGLKKRISSKSPYTQTIQQLNEKERKQQVLSKVKELINENPRTIEKVLNWFFENFAEQLGSPRTRLQWMKYLFDTNDYILLDLRPHISDYYVIPANSFWHAQFTDKCFTFPAMDYQPTSKTAPKKKIYDFLNFRVRNNNFDKVELFAIKMFQAYLSRKEKPIIPEPIYSEVIQLRESWKHDEAKELLEKERQYKEAQQIQIQTDTGFQFLTSLNTEEEE